MQTLSVIPKSGWIRWRSLGLLNDQADFSKVPVESDLLNLATEWIEKLQLSTDDFNLSHNRPREYLYGKQERSSFDKSIRKAKTTIVARQIFLRRSIQGAAVVSTGMTSGLWLSFGPKAELHELDWNGRRTINSIKFALPSQEILRNRLENKTGVHWPLARLNPDFLKEAGAKPKSTFRAREIDVVYFEETPEKLQDFLMPLIRIVGVIDIGQKQVPAIAYLAP